jgi:hypothetical protein
MAYPNSNNSPDDVTNFPRLIIDQISLPNLNGNRTLYSIGGTIDRINYFADQGVYNRLACGMAVDKLLRLRGGENPREVGDLYDLQGGYDDVGRALIGYGILLMAIVGFFHYYGVTAHMTTVDGSDVLDGYVVFEWENPATERDTESEDDTVLETGSIGSWEDVTTATEPLTQSQESF